jgi:cell wall-associated NlpC family hydrolase
MNAARRHILPLLACLALGWLAFALTGCAPAHIPLEPEASQVRLPVTGKPSVVATARAQAGVPYKWGGESPREGFDCSGLTWWSYRQAGVTLPHIANDQYATGRPVAKGDIRAGDLVFFRLPKMPKNLHVGIATGRDSFIHSPREGGRVREDRLDSPYWTGKYVGARRVAASEG